MAKLITNHDPYHVHKVLGLLVLLHYIYRFYLFVETGAAFPPPYAAADDDEYGDDDDDFARRRKRQLALDCAGVLLHGLLSWSSLLLPLPKVRNFNKPMIWPEFRFHSIVFATRHVICTLLSLTGMWPQYENVVANALARAAMVLGTVTAATMVTKKFGCKENRTTNTMPYPANVVEGQQLAIKRMYTSAQFGATVTALMDDPTMNFAPLLGIQMAPLLMTLVRKGKLGTGTYHRVYAVSLSLGYVATFWRIVQHMGVTWGAAATFRTLVLFSLPFRKSRRFVSAQTFWATTIAFFCVLYPLLLEGFVERYLSMDMLAKMVWIGLVRTLSYQVIHYAPLFSGHISGSQRKGPSDPLYKATSTSHRVMNSWGLGGVAWSIGIFRFVQCYSAAEVTGEETVR